MISQNKTIFYALTILLSMTLLNCSTTNKASQNANVKVYEMEFEAVVDVTRQAVRNSGLEIPYVNDSETPQRLYFAYAYQPFVNNDSGRGERGSVEILNLNNGKIQVTIENPEYHFSVPTKSREDYASDIFKNIAKLQ